jgi:hypothetical protein
MSRSSTREQRRDGGSVLVLVLVMSALLMGVLVATLATSDFSDTASTQYGRTSQASLAAQSGLAVELDAMRNVSAYTSFPCGSFSGSLSAPGATSSYSGTITYYPTGSTTALTCSGSTLGGSTVPATATILSTGTATSGGATTMEEQVAIATTSVPAASLGYALFTTNALDLTGAATLTNATGYTANVYSGSTMTCGNGDSTPGAVTTYATVNFTGSCSVGGLTASGQVTLGNSAAINGNLISYGTSITMTGAAVVTGNATETAGTIRLNQGGSPTIDGNAYASGSISVSGGSSIKGTQTPNDAALSGQTMPPAVSFPVLNPSDATWASDGWTVVDVASANCATYFKSNSSGAADPFMTAIDTESTKTVYDAESCTPSYSNSQTFDFNADTVLEVKSYTTANSDTYSSTSSTVHDFSLLASPGVACSTSSTDISVSNSSSFASSLVVFMYTPGAASYANSPSMTGQIVACGGITGSNSFALTFNASASGEIPGSSTTGPPTVSATSKFVS